MAKRIVDMVERERSIRTTHFAAYVAAEIPEREITLDLARSALANRYSAGVKRRKDGIGRPIILSVPRDDGFYVVSSAAYGPVEAQLARTRQVARRDAATKAIERSDRLLKALESNSCTLFELPADVWEAIAA